MRAPQGTICQAHPEYLGKRSKDGRCVRCESERRMAWRKANLEREQAKRSANRERENLLARQRNAENPEPRRKSERKWREANPEKVREANVQRYRANVEANKARVAEWCAANPEKVRAKQAEWRAANKDKIKAQNRKQYEKSDKQKRLQKSREWQEANRDKVRKSVLKWNRANPGITAKRKAQKLNATPAWANEFFIQEAYHLAKVRTEVLGFPWQVDHIVPLISKKVCGLHCENNLRVIPAKLNAAKGNRHWPGMD